MLFGKAAADRKMAGAAAAIGAGKGLTTIMWQKTVFEVNWDVNVEAPARALQALVEGETGLGLGFRV